MYTIIEKNISNIICVGCSSLSVTNGGVTYDKDPSNGVYRPNTKSTASCNNGYQKQRGWESRTCQSNGNWNGWILECIRGNLQLMRKIFPSAFKSKIVICLNKVNHRHACIQ